MAIKTIQKTAAKKRVIIKKVTLKKKTLAKKTPKSVKKKITASKKVIVKKAAPQKVNKTLKHTNSKVTKSVKKKATSSKKVLIKKSALKKVGKTPIPTNLKVLKNKKFKTGLKVKVIQKKVVEPQQFGNRKKYQIEYIIRSSPKILYSYLSTPSGLSAWFADDVTYRDGTFTFHWEGSQSKAKLIQNKENHLLRYQWIEQPSEGYFQFEIVQDDLTLDVALIITDFSPDGEREENILLWNSQIHDLMHLVGSY